MVRRLVELLDRPGEQGGSHVDLTQSRLAALAGASRENVNRALGTLAKEGLVRGGGRRLEVVDPDRLRQIATDPWPAIADRNAVRL